MKFLFWFLLLISFARSFSQENKIIHIYKTDGTIERINIIDIDSITFSYNASVNDTIMYENFDSYPAFLEHYDQDTVMPVFNGLLLNNNWSFHYNNPFIRVGRYKSFPKALELPPSSMNVYKLSRFPDTVYIEYWVYPEAYYNDNGWSTGNPAVGLWNLSEDLAGIPYSVVAIKDSNFICKMGSDRFNICKVEQFAVWYHIRFRFDQVNNETQVWINNEFMGKFKRQTPTGSGYRSLNVYSTIGVESFIDDIIVYTE